jgi:spore maturation protein CgeB
MQKTLKILIAGSFGEYSLENVYAKNFIMLGASVDKFEIQAPFFEKIANNLIYKITAKFYPNLFSESINKQLLIKAESSKADIILVFKGLYLFPSTIATLRNYTKLLVNYNPDHPFIFYSTGSGNSNILHSLEYYHIHFSYSKKIVAKFKSTLKKEAFHIPFGFDDSLKSSSGSKVELKNDFIFVGAWDRTREAFFNKLTDENIKIYGNPEWHSRTFLRPRVKKMFQGKPLLKEDFLQATKDSLGCINILREQNLIENSHNMRTFEVPGYGGLLISQRTDEQLEFFEENIEAIYFDNVDELREKLLYLRKHSEIVEKIKTAAQLRSVRGNYSYFHRAKNMYRIFKEHI